MPTVSIITAVHARGAAFLDETTASVAAQQLPTGWHLEWLVQEDSSEPMLAERFQAVDFANYDAVGMQLGIAATRNLALARASGDVVQVLDADDLLLPGALARLVRAFDDPSIHWAVGQADDLMPDGSRVSWDSAMPYGVLKAGAINKWAEANGANWPIHCAGLMIRTTSLRALGGWVGLPHDEDVAMFAALSEVTDGQNVDQVTWLYRQHPGQVTREKSTRHVVTETRRYAMQRAVAARLAGLRLSDAAPLGAHRGAHLVDVGPSLKQNRPAI
jgi:glycosyltransferase involved in cell wall biosynthesis